MPEKAVSWAVAVLLAFTAGFVDTAGFVGLFGLFTAHVTGNFVLVGASIAGSATGVLGKLLAFPMFVLSVALATVFLNDCRRRNRNAAPAMLMVEAVLLTAFLAAGVGLGPFESGNQSLAIFTGMIGVAAMAVQNAASRSVFSSLSPTTVMTGNVTQMVMDAVSGGDAARARIAKTAPPVAAFAVGAIGGGVGFALIGFYCLAAPIAAIITVLLISSPFRTRPA